MLYCANEFHEMAHIENPWWEESRLGWRSFFSSLLLFRKCVFTNLKLPFLMGFLPIERRYAHIKIEE